MRQRRGSILATAITMVGVMLVMILGASAYVASAQNQVRSDRWRDVADQAARSGLDFVLGWAQADIDQQSKLPFAWESMTDGGVLDPVKQYLDPAPTVIQTVRSVTSEGQALGARTDEFVLGVYGGYVVTFKARIQQYRYSDSYPRQYRIGIIGRVRKAPRPNLAGVIQDDPDTNEKASIVAERMILAYVGKDPCSKYAALIDTDLVRNWVPGEEIWGPVHINRGYVDTKSVISQAKQIGDNGLTTNGGNVAIAGVSEKASDVRSLMLLQTNPGSLFDTPPSSKNFPVFHDEVSLTAVRAQDPTKGTYTNVDTNNLASAVRLVQNGSEKVYDTTTAAALGSQIFVSPENSARKEFGGVAGPEILDQPVQLPTNVRGALPTVLGIPGGWSLYDYRSWFAASGPGGPGGFLDDGVYIPTAKWWSAPMNRLKEPDLAGTAPFSAPPSGGIYVRGNVEIMRMGVNSNGDGKKSYYLFQLGYGSPLNSTSRRCYCVVANRATTGANALTMTIYAFPRGQDLDLALWNIGSNYRAGGNLNLSTIELYFQAHGTDNTMLSAYAMGSGSGYVYHQLPGVNAAGGTTVFPFNGAIYVDLAAKDQARNTNNPMETLTPGPNTVPLTGNIWSLGDLGMAANPWANKRTLDGNVQERVATYLDTNKTGAASKLTIFAEGNIFIQNDILLQSLAGKALTSLSSTGVSVTDSLDLLGLVSGKQVVVGLYAPNSGGTRTGKGCLVEAAIAALGDPAFDYVNDDIDNQMISGTGAYRGSFTTEGLMQVFATPRNEDYNVCYTDPMHKWAPKAGDPTVAANNPADANFAHQPDPSRVDGTPIYYLYPCSGLGAWNKSNQPNVDLPASTGGVRGHLIVFGSVTERKRGIVGIGNRSYDKDFRFDRRLLSIAPPIFPTSVNLQLRSMVPETPTNLPYNGFAGSGTPNLAFMDP